MSFEEFRKELLSCRHCVKLGINPNPIFWGEQCAKVVQISQAPSRNADNSCLPFSKSPNESDESGKKLIEWYGIPRESFYNPKIFYITGIGHCYPGKDERGSDRKPPPVCVDKWLGRELSYLNPKLFIVVGKHAANRLFGKGKIAEFAFRNRKYRGKPTFVIPHPSPAAKNWFKKHPEFEAKRIYDIRKAPHEALQ